MSKFFHICRCNLLFLCVFSVSFNLFAQDSPKEREIKAEETRVLKNINPMTGRESGAPDPLDFLKESKSKKPINKPSREQIEKKIKLEDFEKAKNNIKTPAEYYKKYKKFLNQKNSGLARIFPDRNCDISLSVSVVSVEESERCENSPLIPGRGAYYSFRKQSYYSVVNNEIERPAATSWWDIHFVEGNFIADNCCTQSIISEIGNVDPNSININSSSLLYLKNYKTEKAVKSVSRQNELFLKGVRSDGFVYSRKASARLNNSYVLRTIEYKTTSPKDEYLRVKSDAIWFFKVVGQEEDGSFILLWKKL